MTRLNPHFRSPYVLRSPPPPPPRTRQRQVVNIPVRFVPSIDPSKAAITIQRASRGFLVRKNLKLVKNIEREVDEIVKRIESEEGVEKIMRDERERLRIGEMLMRLLFRLDSVRGVREYRKKVIRRVIWVQDAVDAMSAVRSEQKEDSDAGGVGGEIRENEEDSVLKDGNLMAMQHPAEQNDGELMEIHRFEEERAADMEKDSVLKAGDSTEMQQIKEEDDEAETLAIEDQSPMQRPQTEELENQSSKPGDAMEIHQETEDSVSKACDSMEMHGQIKEEAEAAEAAEAAESLAMQMPEIEETGARESENQSSNPTTNPMEEVHEETGWELVEPREEITKPANETESRRGRGEMNEVMERMAAENDKLKGLVLELCERSAQQCSLMGGLAERVEQLEKMVQKMERKRKKNKRKDAEAIACNPVDKKCGRDDKYYFL